uniref:Uncharacterized protein n=1 Tax=Fagus sylvatica TaxID=28930 RepID=A0A2N9E1Q8_FAGSY
MLKSCRGPFFQSTADQIRKSRNFVKGPKAHQDLVVHADLKASSLQKRLGPHYCPLVTVDTISSPSTANPSVTRNHGEDKRGVEKGRGRLPWPPQQMTPLKIQISKHHYCWRSLVFLIVQQSTVDTSGRTSAMTSAEKSEVMEKTRQATYQSDAALFIVFPKIPAQSSMTKTPHCPVVTADTATKRSTAAPDVTRNHEKKAGPSLYPLVVEDSVMK